MGSLDVSVAASVPALPTPDACRVIRLLKNITPGMGADTSQVSRPARRH